METETPTDSVTLTAWPQSDRYTIQAELDSHRQVMVLTHDQLLAIVQAAYDEHGILATPSYSTEAARTRGHLLQLQAGR